MTNLRVPKLFGKTQVPPLSSMENTATYTVSPELSAEPHPDIVVYYTFPGLEDYLNMPGTTQNIGEETYLPKDLVAK